MITRMPETPEVCSPALSAERGTIDQDDDTRPKLKPVCAEKLPRNPRLSMHITAEELPQPVGSNVGQKILNPEAPAFHSKKSVQKLATYPAKISGIAVSTQEEIAPTMIHTLNAKANIAKKRSILDDLDAPGREVEALELQVARLYLTEFVKKYPLTGTQGISRRMSRKNNPVPLKRSAIQAEIERLLLLLQEKRAARSSK